MGGDLGSEGEPGVGGGATLVVVEGVGLFQRSGGETCGCEVVRSLKFFILEVLNEQLEISNQVLLQFLHTSWQSAHSLISITRSNDEKLKQQIMSKSY